MLPTIPTETLQMMNAELRKYSFENKERHDFLITTNKRLYRKTGSKQLSEAQENMLVDLFNIHILNSGKSFRYLSREQENLL